MLAGIGIGIALLAALLYYGAGGVPLRFSSGDLVRLRSLSDKLRREEVQPFFEEAGAACHVFQWKVKGASVRSKSARR
jgi:hypothetical protein